MIVDDVVRETALVVAVLALAAGCGHGRPPRAKLEPASDEWVANARGVVRQLRADAIAVAGFDRLPAARRGLHDDSQLYGLLVSYTDFGGCLHMAAAVGVAPPGRARVVRLVHRACVHLRRADSLFTRAVAKTEPPLLVAATRAAVAAIPALDAAELALARPS
jgi:hypothetical protein